VKKLKPICNEHEYAEVLAEVSALIDDEPDPNTELGSRFDLLLNLVESYEAKYYSMNSA
jgi:HTH-type transcriptional regulator/antitoxin HigA